MNLSAYPAPNADYQILTRIYPAPHPALHLAPEPTPKRVKGHGFYGFLCKAINRLLRPWGCKRQSRSAWRK